MQSHRNCRIHSGLHQHLPLEAHVHPHTQQLSTLTKRHHYRCPYSPITCLCNLNKIPQSQHIHTIHSQCRCSFGICTQCWGHPTNTYIWHKQAARLSENNRLAPDLVDCFTISRLSWKKIIFQSCRLCLVISKGWSWKLWPVEQTERNKGGCKVVVYGCSKISSDGINFNCYPAQLLQFKFNAIRKLHNQQFWTFECLQPFQMIWYI